MNAKLWKCPVCGKTRDEDEQRAMEKALIGQPVEYRRPREVECRVATVASLRVMQNVHGVQHTRLVLDNGDEVLAEAVYFESPTAPANSRMASATS